MNKYKYSELHGKIIGTYGTLANFAKALEINKNSVTNKLTGRTPWKEPEITKICTLLSIPPSDVAIYFLL
jgi:hypothetical protein